MGGVESFSAEKAGKMISMTDAALAHVRELMAKETQKALRLSVDTTGCSGYMYVLDFIEQPVSGDHACPVAQDVTVYIDNSILPMVQGTRIDYVIEGVNAGMKFDNPNASAQCGCGESFSI